MVIHLILGVATLFNTNFEYTILSVHKDPVGNMISIDINIGEISITQFYQYTRTLWAI